MKQERPEGAHRRLRSFPTRTVEHVRSVHDVRHQTMMRRSAANEDPYKRLQRLAREKETLERRLLIWSSQKERAEAQIADIDREQARILDALEPQMRREEAAARKGPRPLEPVPSQRGAAAL